MSKLSGVIVPNAVPILDDDRVDTEGLRRLIEFLIGAGVHGIFVNGSMGGFAFFPDRVQLATIEVVVDLVAGRLPVLAGVSDTSTVRVLEKVRNVERLPVDYVVVMPPYYYLHTQPEILRFFRTVADAAAKPLVVYDNPRLTKNEVTPATLETLARHANIAGAKISAPDPFKWQEILRRDLPRQRFSLIAGAEQMMSLALQLGFDGITGGLHNVVPDVAVTLFEAAQRGDTAATERCQQKLNRVLKVFEADGGWRGVEVAFEYMGIAARVAPSPVDLSVAREVRQRLLAILAAEGVLRPYAERPAPSSA